MKAMVWTKYGPPEVLQLREVERPVPKKGEVLIKVYAATVTIADCDLRRLKVPFWLRLPLRLLLGLRRPTRVTILGQELAGIIEAAGEGATRFKPGDPVVAACLLHLGAYAEYACLPESYPVLKPAGIAYEEATTLPVGGINGYYFLLEAHIQPGEKVLIDGAGGSIGTYAIQIAKSMGAEVTAVDSAEKLDVLRAIGADHVIDYRREDFTRNGQTYDVIIDVIGKSPFSRSLRALKPGGRYILGNASPVAMIRAPLTRPKAGKKVIVAVASHQPEYYATLTGLMEAGKVKAIIDRRYPLEQLAEAHRYVDTGQKKGNVVITVEHAGEA